MATIHEMLRRARSIDLQAIGVSVIVDTKDAFIDLNKSQLMDKGEDKNSKKLKSYRSASYARKKNQRNPFPGLGTPDLFATGAFQNAFQLKINSKNSFDIFSSNSKSSDLQKKYGAAIFGVSDPNKQEYADEYMQPALVREVRKILKV